MNKDLTETLLSIKKRVEEAKSKKERLTGELNILLSQLKEEYEIESIDDAEKEVERLEKEIKELEEELEKRIEEVRRKLQCNS